MISFPVNEIKREIKTNKDRRFACPGLFRMPEANDGGLCRIKLTLGRLNDRAIDGLAEAAEIYSNGQIEFTTRANLQLRAVAKNDEQKLIAALLALDLGPLTPQGDDIRNVMVAPTAGIDRTMYYDTTKLGDQLLKILQTNKKFSNLSPKFSFLINGGETTEVNDHIADIWLSALPNGKTFNIGFASCPVNNFDGKNRAIGNIPSQMALKFITSCLEAFIFVSKSNPSISRMKHLCHSDDYRIFLAAMERQFGQKIEKPVHLTEKPTNNSALTGIFPQNGGQLFYVGARPQLGRLTSTALRDISKAIKIRARNTPMRLTHHQGIIVPDCTFEEADIIKNRLAVIGLAVDERDPALNIFCCAGAPVCRSGLSNVQRDGKYLIDNLACPPIAAIHLTSCPKACVATVAFPFTALATQEGIYNLYRADGSNEHKFGKLLSQNMTISDIARYIEKVSK